MARRRLILSAPALDDLVEIASWIALENPAAAAKLVKRMLAVVERLQAYPRSGRWVPEAPGKVYREVVAPPCRVVYRVDGSRVLIVHVLRGEQSLDPGRLG